MTDNMTREDYDDEIQSQMILWNQYRFGANVVFAIFMITFLGWIVVEN